MKSINKVFWTAERELRKTFEPIRHAARPLLSGFSMTDASNEHGCFSLVPLPDKPLRLGHDRMRVYRCRLLKSDLVDIDVQAAKEFLRKVRAEILEDMPAGSELVNDVDFGQVYYADANEKVFFVEVNEEPGKDKSAAEHVEFRAHVRYR